MSTLIPCVEEYKQKFRQFSGSSQESALLECHFQILKGKYNILQMDLESAIPILKISTYTAEKYSFHSELAEIYNLIAKVHFSKMNLYKSLEFLHKASEIYELQNNSKKLLVF